MENADVSSSEHSEQGQRLGEAFNRLRSIVELLRGLGFQVIDRFISVDRLRDLTSEMGFPIVRDGADGIRVSYSKRDGLKIWFTNGFEDQENPRRKEVETRLKEAGLI